MAVPDNTIASIEKSLGSNNKVLASAVAKLHLASPDPVAAALLSPDSILAQYDGLSRDYWTDAEVMGALVLVKDSEINAVMFQVYSLTQADTIIFEYELYEDLQYIALSEEFHCFEMEECVAGFAFVDTKVARSFYARVQSYIPTAPIPQESQKQRGRTPSRNAAVNSKKSKRTKKKEMKAKKAAKKKNKKRKNWKKIDLDEIGGVEKAEHMAHVGISDTGGFDVKNLPPELKQIFKQAGIRKKDLRDQETAAAILKTIQTTEMDLHYRQNSSNTAPKDQSMSGGLEQFYTPQQRMAFEKYQEEMTAYNEMLNGVEEAPPPPPETYRKPAPGPIPGPSPALPPRESRAERMNEFNNLMMPSERAITRKMRETRMNQDIPPKVMPRVVEQRISYDPVQSAPAPVPRRTDVANKSPEQRFADFSTTPAAFKAREEKGSSRNRGFSFLDDDDEAPPKVLPRQSKRDTKKEKEELTLMSPRFAIGKSTLRRKAKSFSSETRESPEPEKFVVIEETRGQEVAPAEPVEPPKPEIIIQKEVVEVVRYEKSEQLLEMERKMKEALEQAEKAKREAEELKQARQNLLDQQEAAEKQHKAQLRAHQEELEETRRRADELALAKEKEEKEKQALQEAKAEAELAIKKLKEEKNLTAREKAEALARVQETQKAVREAQVRMEQTEDELRKAQEMAEQQRLVEENQKKELEIQKQELAKVKAKADDLQAAKEREEAEKLKLQEAKMEADKAILQLREQHNVTAKERQEALKRVAETKKAVQEAQARMKDTEEKLKDAEKRAKALPPPPPDLLKIPKLPPLLKLQKPNLPALPPPPPLPPAPKIEKPPPMKKKERPKGALNMAILGNIKNGVKLAPVVKKKDKAAPPGISKKPGGGMSLIDELRMRQKKVLRPKDNRKSTNRAINKRLQRTDFIKNPEGANLLLGSLEQTIAGRRARMKGKNLDDDDDSGSDWTL